MFWVLYKQKSQKNDMSVHYFVVFFFLKILVIATSSQKDVELIAYQAFDSSFVSWGREMVQLLVDSSIGDVKKCSREHEEMRKEESEIWLENNPIWEFILSFSLGGGGLLD